jgi:hypothetical protein
VIVMLSRHSVIDALHRLGSPEAADETGRVLPDPVDLKQLQEFSQQHGIPHDELISRSGGSP